MSSLNTTDKMPTYEMPLNFVFGIWGFGVEGSIFLLGFLALAF